MKFFIFIFSLLCQCLLLGEISRAQQIVVNRPMVIAHRGASAYAPENTVASAKLGWELGAEGVEVDVHLSADHHIVVIHDRNTGRTTGEKLEVSETPLSVLETLDAGSWKDEKYKGERIPTLSEIVAVIPNGKKLVVEIKSDINLVPVLENEFKQNPNREQLLFIAFDYETIKAVKKAFPENKAYWLSSRFSENVQTVLEKVKSDGLDGVDLHFSLITPELMEIANELQLEVHCWTVDDLQKAAELGRLHVNSITTNIPDQVLVVLEKQ